MVNFYVSLITREEMTVEEVPKLWREKVKAIIEGSTK